ncbi:hypothetical protein D3C72_2318830 [compost metagenome]
MQRRFVVQVRVLLALGVDGLGIGRELAGGRGGHVDHRDHGVHGAGILDLGPVEGLDQGLG